MLNVAVIGTGNMGKNHARVYFEMPNVNLVAVSDIDNVTGEGIAQKYSCKFYNNYLEMLDSEEIDAISVVVPTKLHRAIALDCINYKKHVLVEKPISHDLKTAREIINCANDSGMTLTVGHIERHNPVIKKIKELIDAGELGEINSISSKRLGPFPPQNTDVNIVIDWGVHDIDICSYLTGQLPNKIYYSVKKAVHPTLEDHAVILLEYENAIADIEVSWLNVPKKRTLSITGTKHIEADYINQTADIIEGSVERGYDDFDNLTKKFASRKIKIPIHKKEPLKEELRDFISAIKQNRDPLVTGENGYQALKIALAITNKNTGYLNKN